MKIIKCKICGHEIKTDDNEEYVRCESCGSYNEVSIKIPLGTLRCIRCNTPLDLKKVKNGVLECSHCHQVMTFPKDNQADNVISVIKRGKECLDISNFDEAYNLFTKAIELDPSEPEGYFNRALARFKVQYLRDLVNRRMQPICHAIRDNMFSEDSDYKKSLELAKDTQKKEYQRKANEIDQIKREFAKLEEQGIDYDCFICVKVTDDYRNKTEDYHKAYEIYYMLKNNGFNPFFSETTLSNYVGEAYEARILYALHKSECMLLICSDEKYLDTPWVKNEYTRFKSLIDTKEKEEGSLCIVYNQKPIEHIPTINHKLQGIDRSRIDASDIIRNFLIKYSVNNIVLLNDKSKLLKKINLMVLRNKKTDAIELLFDALENDDTCYEIWDKLFELCLKHSDYKDKIEELYYEALEELNDDDRRTFENKYSSYVIKDKKITSNNVVKPIDQKELIKKVKVNTLEEYKQKVIDGYIDIEYPNDIEKEIIEFLESNKDKNENILCQYGAFVLDRKIKTTNNYKDACEIMSKLANKNNVMAQSYLGKCYKNGDGVDKDINQAFFWFKKSAEQGDIDTQYYLGRCYYFGDGVEKDYSQAAYWYKKSAEQGNAKAQYRLGTLYGIGEGVEQDYAQAFNWYKKSAEQGNMYGQYFLGEYYYYGDGIEQDYVQAVYWYKKAAEQGDADAQYNLGYCYNYGQGVEKDYTQAFYWYKKSAEQGNATAQCNLGYCYDIGQGVNQDYTQAFYWYKKSAERGNATAQNNLGNCYYNGQGVEQDYTQAFYWYKKSAEQGDGDAQYNLAVCYDIGQGVNQDYTQAFNWYKKSAEQGSVRAQYKVGKCYYYGEGVQYDYSMAKYWLTKAAEKGNEEAKKLLKNL